MLAQLRYGGPAVNGGATPQGKDTSGFTSGTFVATTAGGGSFQKNANQEMDPEL